MRSRCYSTQGAERPGLDGQLRNRTGSKFETFARRPAKSLILMARETGLEPATSGVTGQIIFFSFQPQLRLLPALAATG